MRRSELAAWVRNLRLACLVSSAAFAVSGCAIRNIGPTLHQGGNEIANFPSADQQQMVPDYRLGPFDSLETTVFQEPDLSSKNVQVDAAGRIRLPLIGEVTAAGKTPVELSRELEALYGEKYLVRPQITVNVTSAVSQKVIVQGEVRTPGVYPIKGAASLLEAFSLAGGETQVAALNQVVVFRVVNGQRMGAIFDVASIRRGDAPDPAIYGNDVIIVGFSNVRGAYRDLLTTVPIFNVFRYF